jgi:hypothetical protein
MSTWIDDLKDPKLQAAYRAVGNQDRQSLRNMVRALSSFSWMNSADDKRRLLAAQYILKHSGKN